MPASQVTVARERAAARAREAASRGRPGGLVRDHHARQARVRTSRAGRHHVAVRDAAPPDPARLEAARRHRLRRIVRHADPGAVRRPGGIGQLQPWLRQPADARSRQRSTVIGSAPATTTRSATSSGRADRVKRGTAAGVRRQHRIRHRLPPPPHALAGRAAGQPDGLVLMVQLSARGWGLLSNAAWIRSLGTWCRSGSSPARHGRASPGRCAGRRRPPAGGSPSRAGGRAARDPGRPPPAAATGAPSGGPLAGRSAHLARRGRPPDRTPRPTSSGRPVDSQASRARRAGAPIGTVRSLLPLPSTRTVRAVGVDVAQVEPAELRHPDPAGVEHLEDRDVAQPDRAAQLLGPLARPRSASLGVAAVQGRRAGIGPTSASAGPTPGSSRTGRTRTPRHRTPGQPRPAAAESRARRRGSAGWPASCAGRGSSRRRDRCVRAAAGGATAREVAQIGPDRVRRQRPLVREMLPVRRQQVRVALAQPIRVIPHPPTVRPVRPCNQADARCSAGGHVISKTA